MNWKKWAVGILATASTLCAVGHNEKGTDYGSQGVLAYEQVRHGPDGARFLDPYFIPLLTKVDGKHVFDAGCGAGPWAIYASQHGASVFALDLQPTMIDRAQRAAEKAGVADRIIFQTGDVGAVPQLDETFDMAMSINVGCNLNSSQLLAHCGEMYRVLKCGGEAIVTAPSSFATLFTDGTDSQPHIDRLLEAMPSDPSPQQITTALNELTEVYRATFVARNHRLVQVVDSSILVNGEPIWRKLPGLVVPNNYHPDEEYLHCFSSAGFTVTEIHRPQFTSQEEWLESGRGFNQAYLESHPFSIYHLKKER